MHQEGLKKLGTFIKPVDLRDSMTGFVKVNLTKKIPPTSPGSIVSRRRLHPIQEEMDQKQIILLDEDTDENGLPASLTEEDRKFIVPMALKNVAPDARYPQTSLGTTPTTRTTTTSTTTTKTTTLTPDFAANIDDLKNHILFLQNMTKHNSNFQSKFVVFPSLQKDKQAARITPATTTTSRPFFRYTPPVPPPTRRTIFSTRPTVRQQISGYFDGNIDNEDTAVFVGGSPAGGKITIVPQVLLLNDQTPADEEGKVNNRQDGSSSKDQRVIYSKRRNFRKNSTSTSSSTTTTGSQPTTITSSSSSSPASITTTEPPYSRRNSKRPRTNNNNNNNKNQRKPCQRNPDSPKCQRMRRRQELQQRERDEELYRQKQYQPFLQTINNTKRFAVSIEIPDSFKIPQNQTATLPPLPSLEVEELILSRPARSHHKRRNIGAKYTPNYGSTYYDGSPSSSKDFLMPSVSQFNGAGSNAANMFLNNTAANPTTIAAAYSETIDLNPELCYQVDGLTYGQKKQCVMHTSVMPAISRGARAAIQECQYQFKNRRWNCSTTEDNSVFGPMSSLGSPEMAFIHALAAATVTSFIARACRDGQLASCGCSRGTRPKQLHDDWTWGGCGDDLEFAYKFSQDFIDIREKERKRGTRGVAAQQQQQKNAKHHQEGKPRVAGMQADAAPPPAVNEGQNGTSSNSTTTTKFTGDATLQTDTTTDQDGKRRSSFNKTVTANDNKSNTATTTHNSNSSSSGSSKDMPAAPVAPPPQETEQLSRFKPEDLLELQERITKEILNSKLQEKEMIELQEKINREILNSKVFNLDNYAPLPSSKKRKNQRAVNGNSGGLMGVMPNMGGAGMAKWKNGLSAKARSLMNLHNNEAGRRAVIKKTRITCKCHGVSGSCSLITCWQQLSSIREIGDYLRDKYEESTEVKLNKRGRLQVKDAQYKVPTAHDLVYLDESPDWCRYNRQLQWPGTHGRVCNKTSSGLDGCGILCCGRGYNTKNIVVRERCNCKFHWCCQVKCDVCVKVLEEHTCK